MNTVKTYSVRYKQKQNMLKQIFTHSASQLIYSVQTLFENHEDLKIWIDICLITNTLVLNQKLQMSISFYRSCKVMYLINSDIL